ncbi:hypothetical protein ACWT_4139 [Actinoplanes sp. SE50]|uniref:maleylpyruvate isomerase N-terminal domain-containing protein n=1 Tax=unclassified Actinoplanes TaxID=2626549 RepID=UPI00023EBF4A|nr:MULTISPECIES: maleylpyruvate isomerase N-terminal domain-containing protein [unclassified Actinoplanes]AEV85161.1 hypothetical protein ACPL_4268 [Actinoplanes sp. SE50/110]ATO83554.1 hypothetical protein ACWT_4139 [Actinoplanes sp. SE50]SLM00961.1 hypothetical protein ACSP50_4194 [Actinoplanes sp. SE50/110]
MDWLTPDRYLSALESETTRLITAIRGRAAGEPIPTCPDWTLRDLVTHVGTGHRTATGVIRSPSPTPPAYAVIPAPDDPDDWPGWLSSGAADLIAAVRDVGFDTTVWAWVPKYPIAGFWARRMLHDLIIHRFDVAPGGDLDQDLAVDGVSDILLCCATLSARPQPRMAGLRGAGETLRFSDGRHTWHATLTPTGAAWTDTPDVTVPAAVTLRAPAKELLLTLNRRREPGPSTGDRALLRRWLANSRF